MNKRSKITGLNRIKFELFEGEIFRVIPLTKGEFLISNFGRLARCDSVFYWLVKPTKNSFGEYGLNLLVPKSAETITTVKYRETYKFVPMQRIMACVFLFEGVNDFRVTTKDKDPSNWSLENLKVNYNQKPFYWLGVPLKKLGFKHETKGLVILGEGY